MRILARRRRKHGHLDERRAGSLISGRPVNRRLAVPGVDRDTDLVSLLEAVQVRREADAKRLRRGLVCGVASFGTRNSSDSSRSPNHSTFCRPKSGSSAWNSERDRSIQRRVDSIGQGRSPADFRRQIAKRLDRNRERIVDETRLARHSRDDGGVFALRRIGSHRDRERCAGGTFGSCGGHRACDGRSDLRGEVGPRFVEVELDDRSSRSKTATASPGYLRAGVALKASARSRRKPRVRRILVADFFGGQRRLGATLTSNELERASPASTR